MSVSPPTLAPPTRALAAPQGARALGGRRVPLAARRWPEVGLAKPERGPHRSAAAGGAWWPVGPQGTSAAAIAASSAGWPAASAATRRRGRVRSSPPRWWTMYWSPRARM